MMLTRPRVLTLSYFLSLTLMVSLFQASTPMVLVAQQQPHRERRVASQGVKGTATPTPLPTASPSPVVSTVETLQPSPTPTPDVVPTRGAFTTRTLGELQARISAVLRKTELAPAMVGIKVASLESGKVLFEENANKLLRPASNMKLYTVAAALDRLSPDFRFVTSVYARAKPNADGVVDGDLTIYGRGDPSFAARFN